MSTSSKSVQVSPSSGIRWWPVKLLAVVVVSLAVWMKLFGVIERGVTNALIFGLGLASLGCLAIWLKGFSRIARRQRRRIFGIAIVLLITPIVLLRVDDYSGAIVPVLAWRWSRPLAAEVEVLDKNNEVIGVRLTPTPYDYPRFLGANRDGIVRGVQLSRNWKTRRPVEIWRRPIGKGWSSFAVVGDFAITQQQGDQGEEVVCLELRTGKIRWIHRDDVYFQPANAGERVVNFGGDGPRATPTIHEGRVYTLGATGLLNCLSGTDGSVVWSKDILADNDAEPPRWGVCGSPLIVDEKVIVSAGGTNGKSLVAYHNATGEPIWSGGDDRAHYGSPTVAVLAGVRQALSVNRCTITGHDMETGAVLWRYVTDKNDYATASQPVVLSGDRVFVSKGYGVGCAMLQIRHEDGQWSAKPLWRSRNMKTKFSNVVLRGHYAYGLDDLLLGCIDLRNGKRMWKRRGFDHGQVLMVDDLLLVQAEDGQVVLLEVSPRGPRELGRLAALSDKTWNNPVVAGPYLLVRNSREAACYELPTEPVK